MAVATIALRGVLAFCRRYWVQILAVLAVVAALALARYAVTAYGARQFEAGRQQVLAADAIAAAAAQAKAEQRATDAAAAGTALHAKLDIALPKIEADTHDAAEKIRTIYLAAPAAAGVVCQRPDGVQAELDAARSRANVAARGDL